MTTQLTGSHRTTFNAIFRHPAAHNLKWRDVHSMLAALADVVEEPNGNLKVSRGQQTLVLRPSRDKDVADIGELVEIRHFLDKSGTVAAQAAASGTHLLVVIDHREARIYQTELAGLEPQRITPYDPTGSGRYLHNVQDDANGQRRPEIKSFYEAVAHSLQPATQILLFGSSTGASSAMEQLLAALKERHASIAARVVGSVVVDEQHMTENQLLAKAREFYAGLGTGKPAAALATHA